VKAKQTIAGYALVEVSDLDQALAMATRWPASAAVELRPVVA